MPWQKETKVGETTKKCFKMKHSIWKTVMKKHFFQQYLGTCSTSSVAQSLEVRNLLSNWMKRLWKRQVW